MAEVKITFCNTSYAEAWYKQFKNQNKIYFIVLEAIINEIEIKRGGDINKADIFERSPTVQQHVRELDIDIVPSRGQMLRYNGNGIRHAKFTPSKSTAVVWENIGDIIYVTFDDHAPIRYHRAISHLRDIKRGKPVFPKRPRTTGRLLRKLKSYWKYRFFKGPYRFDPKSRYYE